MNAHDARASQNADDDGRRRARDALPQVVAGAPVESLIHRMFDERFARGPQQNGQAEFVSESIESVDELEVLFGGLAEPDAGVEDDPLPPRPATERFLDRPSQSADHFCEDVVDWRLLMHHSGRAARMHQNQRGARLRRDLGHGGVEPESADVVDDLSPRSKRGPRDLTLSRVDGDRNSQPAPQRFDHGHYAAYLFFGAYRLRSGPGRFAANIQNVRALGLDLEGAGDRALEIGVLPAVREGIGRHIERAHHLDARFEFECRTDQFHCGLNEGSGEWGVGSGPKRFSDSPFPTTYSPLPFFTRITSSPRRALINSAAGRRQSAISQKPALPG